MCFMIFFGLVSSFAIGQDFSLSLSKDTILEGNTIKITFVANNIEGQFEAPDLSGLKVVSGPNTSVSMTSINGETNRNATYTYLVMCDQIGEYTVLSAYYDTENGALETEPTSFLVVPNPEGIIENPPHGTNFFQFEFPQLNGAPKKEENKKTKKKKRKLKKL